jgi:hypothetical protein
MNTLRRLELPATTKRKWNRISLPTIDLRAAVMALVGLGVAAKPAQQAKDAETCGACHEDVVKTFASRTHAALSGQSCTACHGSGEKHIEEGGKTGIFYFYFLIIPVLLSGSVTSIILTPSEYVQCESIFPDQSFDFFGIPENLILPSFAFHQSQWPSPETFSSQTTPSKLALFTILRC